MNLKSKLYKIRSSYWRYNRILFASPAEVYFIELMGGKCKVINNVRHRKTGFPMVIILSLGKYLKSENYKREVRVGSKYVDFGNDLQRGIEINGRQWHSDVVAEQKHRDYLEDRGWIILHIDVTDMYRQPSKTQR